MALVQSPRPSLSTVRDPFMSSGRGGSGNIRRSSVGRSSLSSVDASDAVSLRDKEGSSCRVVSVGRGGNGNIKLPSPDLADHTLAATILSEYRETEHRYEQQIRKHHEESKVVASSGRGGMGNIHNNRRSKSKPPCSALARKGRRKPPEHTGIDALHLINSEGLGRVASDIGAEGGSNDHIEPRDSPSCSRPSQDDQQRSGKKRIFLKMWKRPHRSSTSPLDHASIIDTTTNDDNPDSSPDCPSFPRASISGHSGDGASTISSYSSSASRSIMSVQSLPTLPENREYVSFLEL
ncbi:hypothetical protein EDC04DRAFT_3142851 [Pisolithus marmoratus]|nr:hypothetical protein EDC04DRAFT_3142851 [Pisolithus marmoratus]